MNRRDIWFIEQETGVVAFDQMTWGHLFIIGCTLELHPMCSANVHMTPARVWQNIPRVPGSGFIAVSFRNKECQAQPYRKKMMAIQWRKQRYQHPTHRRVSVTRRKSYKRMNTGIRNESFIRVNVVNSLCMIYTQTVHIHRIIIKRLHPYAVPNGPHLHPTLNPHWYRIEYRNIGTHEALE